MTGVKDAFDTLERSKTGRLALLVWAGITVIACLLFILSLTNNDTGHVDVAYNPPSGQGFTPLTFNFTIGYLKYCQPDSSGSCSYVTDDACTLVSHDGNPAYQVTMSNCVMYNCARAFAILATFFACITVPSELWCVVNAVSSTAGAASSAFASVLTAIISVSVMHQYIGSMGGIEVTQSTPNAMNSASFPMNSPLGMAYNYHVGGLIIMIVVKFGFVITGKKCGAKPETQPMRV